MGFVEGFFHDICDGETDLCDDVILIDLVIKSVFLYFLIVCAYDGITERASTVFPSPELFCCWEYVCSDFS